MRWLLGPGAVLLLLVSIGEASSTVGGEPRHGERPSAR